MLFHSSLCEDHHSQHRHGGNELEALALPEVVLVVAARAIGLLHGHLILELLELLVSLLPNLQRQEAISFSPNRTGKKSDTQNKAPGCTVLFYSIREQTVRLTASIPCIRQKEGDRALL